uniref:Putative secreted protein n=1 Tax=Anopheles marajoara TaxID=58244 RepID=A0A2M4CFS6_9DIPT
MVLLVLFSCPIFRLLSSITSSPKADSFPKLPKRVPNFKSFCSTKTFSRLIFCWFCVHLNFKYCTFE